MTVVLLSRPAPGFGAAADEQPAPKPKATKTPASAPRVETAAPPVSAQPAAPPASESGRRPSLKRIEGAYAVEGGGGKVSVRCLFGDFFHVSSSDGWEGVGILDGAVYRGVFRHGGGPDATEGATGDQSIDWSDPENPTLRATYTSRRTGEFMQRWRRLADSGKGPVVKPSPAPTQPPKVMVTPDHRPEFGEYVYVDELPEALTKVAPIYPEGSHAGVEGVVLVQALVLEDGSVGDCRIVKSMPGFDEAAVASVRQWRFKPALSAGRPVATWVAVPVRFTLH